MMAYKGIKQKTVSCMKVQEISLFNAIIKYLHLFQELVYNYSTFFFKFCLAISAAPFSHSEVQSKMKPII